MAEEIEIIVTATGFDKVSSGLKNTTEALKTTATEAKKTGEALKGTLNNGAAQAGQSLTNLSRIAQDAPFGFIGIANNLNPLVESFGRLKAETGSTGGALKALVAGLSGPAGLGLAFGVVTSAISFAQIGFDRWTGSTKKAKEQINELKKAQEDFVKSIDAAKSGALSTGLALQSYVDIAKNGQLPLEQRNEALKQANQILGKHGELLTLTNIETAAATKEVELYTNALIAQAVAQKYVDDLAKNIVERTKLQKDLTAATIEYNKTQKDLKDAQIRADQAVRAGAYGYNLIANEIEKNSKASERLKSIQISLAAVNKNIANSQKEFTNSTLEATAAFGQLGYKQTESKKKTEKTKKAVETLTDAYNAFIQELVNNQKLATLFNEPVLKKNIDSFETFIKLAVEKFNANARFTLPLVVELNSLKRSLEVVKPKDLVKSLQDKFNATPIKLPFEIPKGSIENLKKEAVILVSDLQKALIDSFNIIGKGIGEGIANAITGTANFGDIFKGIFQQLGGVVQALGEQILAVGIAAVVASDSLKQIFVNPYAAIAAGIALVALGSLIQSTTTPRNRFAVGTRFAPGGMALVGERGPELVNLPRGSQVVPAAQTSNMMGGISEGIEIYGILRGQDIYFSNKKYSATYARTT
jgi:hypothetical protein